MPTRILIVEDHPIYAEALRLALGDDGEGVTTVVANSLRQAKAALSQNGGFQLVLLDLWLPDTQGLDGLVELRGLFPKLPIVVVSGFTSASVVGRVMMCGAAGFISKSADKRDFSQAIRRVLSGEVVVPPGKPDCAGQPAHARAPEGRLKLLTQQQLRVLQMLCQGKLNKQIAHELGVGETTVKAHVSEILRKLEVSSRTQAVVEVSKLDFESFLHLRTAGAITGPLEP